MVQPIVLYSSTHKILRTKTKRSDINKDRENLEKLIGDMKDTLQSVGGLGLAANQLGRDESVCLVKINDEIITLINPVITKRSGEQKTSIEGCLSLPDITAKVERDEIISVKFINPDADWSEQEIQVEFPNSVVIQHELDHLNGKLMIDNFSPMQKNLIQTKLKKISRGNANMNYVGMIWRDSVRSWSLVGSYMKLMEFYMQTQKTNEENTSEISQETSEEITS
jgi:peptide deformylase